MIDIQQLRKNPIEIAERLASRGPSAFDVLQFQALEARRKQLQTKVEQGQALRNRIARQVSEAKAKGAGFQQLIEEGEKVRQDLEVSEEQLAILQEDLHDFVSRIPNIPHGSVPIGRSSEENREERRWGQIPKLVHPPKGHIEVGERLGLDFAAATKITGSRFVLMRGGIAHLHRAIGQFMLDVHSREHGYVEIYAPYIVNDVSAFGTGQLPKFEGDLFQVSFGGIPGKSTSADVLVSLPPSYPAVPPALKIEARKWYLIPTAEVPVTNIVRDETLSLDSLPLKFVCHTPCFRSEAGSYGKDTRGMIRQHQFDKVELVQVVNPTESYRCLEELTGHAEAILKKLELPYRVVTLCTGDMGAAAAKTYDIEVWLPGQNMYREISSCSNFEAYQARRMKARFKNEKGKPEFVHTLNGSGLAVGRTLVAILENFQNPDGSVTIPEVLRRYMHGQERIA